MQVSNIMTTEPVVVAADASLDEAMQLMDDNALRHLPALESGKVVGVISDRDLLELTGWLHPRVREILDAPTGTVSRFMHTPVVTVSPDQPTAEAVALMVEHEIGCLPVVEHEALVGIVTETDVLRAFRDGCKSQRVATDIDVSASAYMTAEVITAEPSASAEEAAEILRDKGFRHLPVVVADRLVGIVSDRDVRLAIGRGELENMPVETFMTKRPVTIGLEASLSVAASLMLESRVSSLPVVDGDQLVGIVCMRDVLEPCVQALQQSAKTA